MPGPAMEYSANIFNAEPPPGGLLFCFQQNSPCVTHTFFRQNPGHIRQRHIILIFQPGPQKIKILLLSIPILLILPEKAGPFINQYNNCLLYTSDAADD